jgi:hypothetical protein
MASPGFTAEKTLYHSRKSYSHGYSRTGANAHADRHSVKPAFWAEIGEFLSDAADAIAAPACRAACWGLGAAGATGCTTATFGTGAPLCAGLWAAAASTCSDSC